MKRHEGISPLAALCLPVFGFLLLGGCRPPAPSLLPPPEIRSLEGYASLRLSKEWAGAKSRLSFQVLPPGRGRVEVFDALGRVVLYFVVDGPEAQLVVPSKKVYCAAASEEVMSRFIGFGLDLEEWTAVLSGVWPAASPPGDEPLGWSLERDGRNRVLRGRKGGLFFEVTEFFKNSPSPRRLSFGSEQGGGRLTVLSLRYNSPLRDASFLLSPPASFERRTWEEVERLFRRDD